MPKQTVYLPFLLIQRRMIVKDLDDVNYRKTLIDEPTIGKARVKGEILEGVPDGNPIYRPDRGGLYFFEYKGLPTSLYELEYELLKDILENQDNIEELTILLDQDAIEGFSPKFDVLAVLTTPLPQ